ncbi:hypothetical protein CI102_31 [Trichoderma harzianum]|nr:hypothetical protein CI102_31 [Trichoderma harzianum]
MQLNFGLLSSIYQRSLTLSLLLPNGSQAAIKGCNHVRTNLTFLLPSHPVNRFNDSASCLHITSCQLHLQSEVDLKESRLSRVQGIIILEQLTLPVLNG